MEMFGEEYILLREWFHKEVIWSNKKMLENQLYQLKIKWGEWFNGVKKEGAQYLMYMAILDLIKERDRWMNKIVEVQQKNKELKAENKKLKEIINAKNN